MSYTTLVTILLLAGYACGDASAPTPAVVVPEADATAVTEGRAVEDWTSVLGCVFKPDVSVCLQQRAMRAMKKWLQTETVKSAELVALAKEDEDDEKPGKDKGILDTLGDLVSFGMSRFMQFVDDDDDDKQGDDDEDEEEDDEKQEDEKEEDEEEDEGRSLVEERKKKKKIKIKPLKTIIVLTVVAKILKELIYLKLAKLGFHLQVKFFVVAVLSLLVNIGRLIVAVRRLKTPEKLVYYEHANHQHHYEHAHHHDYEDNHGQYGHKEDDKQGWLGNLWNEWQRSFGSVKTVPKVRKVVVPPPYVPTYPVVQESAPYQPQYFPQYVPQYQPQYQQRQLGQELAYVAQQPKYRAQGVENDNNDED